MKISNILKSILHEMEVVFMTNHKCLSCGKEIKDGTKFQLCEKCFSKLEIIGSNYCKKCGTLVSDELDFCGECQKFNYAFNHNRSFCFYNEISSKIVLKLKYNNKKYFADEISKIMAENKEIFQDIDVITFVPSSKKRMKERGYNQAELIAKSLGEIFNIPVENLLDKISETKHQTGASQAQRKKNLAKTFLLNNSVDIKNKNVLIIDDVFTTGSTLDECSKELLKGRPKEINCYTFAKTKFLNSEKVNNSAK